MIAFEDLPFFYSTSPDFPSGILEEFRGHLLSSTEKIYLSEDKSSDISRYL